MPRRPYFLRHDLAWQVRHQPRPPQVTTTNTTTMTTTPTNWRALFDEHADELSFGDGTERVMTFDAFQAAVAAALAQPEPEGPTDEELMGLDDLENAWNAQADAANSWDELGIDEIVWFAQRQALTRWGRAAVTPTPCDEATPTGTIERDMCSYLVPIETTYGTPPANPDDVQVNPEASMGYWTAGLGEPWPESEPKEWPTDEEIGEWAAHCAYLTRTADCGGAGTGEHYWAFDVESDYVASIVRAALAHWGRPAIEPVPVKEGK